MIKTRCHGQFRTTTPSSLPPLLPLPRLSPTTTTTTITTTTTTTTTTKPQIILLLMFFLYVFKTFFLYDVKLTSFGG